MRDLDSTDDAGAEPMPDDDFQDLGIAAGLVDVGASASGSVEAHGVGLTSSGNLTEELDDACKLVLKLASGNASILSMAHMMAKEPSHMKTGICSFTLDSSAVVSYMQFRKNPSSSAFQAQRIFKSVSKTGETLDYSCPLFQPV